MSHSCASRPFGHLAQAAFASVAVPSIFNAFDLGPRAVYVTRPEACINCVPPRRLGLCATAFTAGIQRVA